MPNLHLHLHYIHTPLSLLTVLLRLRMSNNDVDVDQSHSLALRLDSLKYVIASCALWRVRMVPFSLMMDLGVFPGLLICLCSLWL